VSAAGEPFYEPLSARDAWFLYAEQRLRSINITTGDLKRTRQAVAADKLAGWPIGRRRVSSCLPDA